MRPVFLALSLTCAVATAQKQPSPPAATKLAAPNDWRRLFLTLPGQPAANTSVQDLERLERDLRLATPYCLAATPVDFDANREVVRRVTAYLAAVNLMAQDPRLRGAYNRAFLAAAALPCMGALAPGGPPPAAVPVPVPVEAGPPFPLEAPELANVPQADQRTARELQMRYESAAARAATAWQNTETLKQSLAAQAMTLNARTAASVSRMQLLLKQAAEGLRGHEWEEARTKLEGAEYETEKVFKTAGR